MIKLERTSSDNMEFQDLVVLLDQELAVRNGSEHSFYAQYNTIDKIRHVVVCYSEEEAIGCGAFKPYINGTVEIKRMFVKPAHRGHGVAKTILKELETWTAELGFTSCILETGKRQPEAIRLYQKSGYQMIPNYGQYEGVENSVCMQKALA